MLNAKDSAEVMVNGYSHNNVTFRCADRKDVSLILHFIKKLAAYEKVPEAVHATEELLEEWMFEKNRSEAIFAMVDGTEVGFVFFYQTFPAYLGKGGIYIDDLYIDPEYRGRGIGKKLISHMAKVALERKCARIEWCCLNWNESSMEFYRSLGAVALDECTIFRAPESVLTLLAEGEFCKTLLT